MKILKWLGGLIAVYVVLVVVFEAGYLGMMQPSFEEGGIPMLVLTVTDEEFDAIATAYKIPFVARLLMGFPPPRDILRLDPLHQ